MSSRLKTLASRGIVSLRTRFCAARCGATAGEGERGGSPVASAGGKASAWSALAAASAGAAVSTRGGEAESNGVPLGGLTRAASDAGASAAEPQLLGGSASSLRSRCIAAAQIGQLQEGQSSSLLAAANTDRLHMQHALAYQMWLPAEHIAAQLSLTAAPLRLTHARAVRPTGTLVAHLPRADRPLKTQAAT